MTLSFPVYMKWNERAGQKLWRAAKANPQRVAECKVRGGEDTRDEKGEWAGRQRHKGPQQRYARIAF